MSNFQYILSNFGLQYLRPKFYGNGKALEHQAKDYQFQQWSDNPVKMDNAPDGQVVKGWLGTPVWSDIILKGGDITLQLLTVLCVVNMQKNIVKTVIQGRNGTVKEYISDGDYQIQIVGGFFDQQKDRYPIEKVQDLITICKLSEAVEVYSPFLQLFNIYEIVIESYEIPQDKGKQNSQLFNLKCVSDEPLPLTLNAE